MKPGDGLTIGNVAFAGSSAKSTLRNDAFTKHETTHSSQWAKYGAFMFVELWLGGLELSVLRGHDESGGGGCLNPLEHQAGAFVGSGYASCG